MPSVPSHGPSVSRSRGTLCLCGTSVSTTSRVILPTKGIVSFLLEEWASLREKLQTEQLVFKRFEVESLNKTRSQLLLKDSVYTKQLLVKNHHILIGVLSNEIVFNEVCLCTILCLFEHRGDQNGTVKRLLFPPWILDVWTKEGHSPSLHAHFNNLINSQYRNLSMLIALTCWNASFDIRWLSN